MFLEETDKEKKRNRAISIGGESLSEALRLYGFSNTVDFMIRLSVRENDWVINELLSIIPGLFVFSNFLKSSIKFEIDSEVVLEKIKTDPTWLRRQGVL